MPNPVQFDITVGALPEGLSTDPQGLLQAFAERLFISPSVPWSSFWLGASMPTSDVGPWFKNGMELWVWSDALATYTPVQAAADTTAAAGSDGTGYPTLGYTIAKGVPTEPDPTIYRLWFVLNVTTGNLEDVRAYTNGAWNSLLTAPFAAFNAAIGKLQVALAESLVTYPVWAGLTVDQTVDILSANYPTKLLFSRVGFDNDSTYDAANSRFICPVDGVYQVSCELQIDNVDGVAADMEISLGIFKNGGGTGYSTGTSVASPPGLRWYPKLSGLVEAATGDVLEIYLSLDDNVRTGSVTVAAGGPPVGNSTVNYHLVRRLTPLDIV
jgi:hypothetical protein